MGVSTITPTYHLLFYAVIMMMMSITMKEGKKLLLKITHLLKYNGYYLRSIVCHGGAFYLVIQI